MADQDAAASKPKRGVNFADERPHVSPSASESKLHPTAGDETFITGVGLESAPAPAPPPAPAPTPTPAVTPTVPSDAAATLRAVMSHRQESAGELELRRRKAAQKEAIAAANGHERFPELTPEYYAFLPFQPGVNSLLWMAVQAAAGRRITGVRVPHTLVSDGTETAWLRTVGAYDTGATPSLSAKLGGSLDV